MIVFLVCVCVNDLLLGESNLMGPYMVALNDLLLLLDCLGWEYDYYDTAWWNVWIILILTTFLWKDV